MENEKDLTVEETEKASSVEAAEENNPETETKTDSSEKPAETKTETKPSNGKKKAIIGIGIAAVVVIALVVILLVVIIAIVLFFTLHKSTVNLNDYITIEASGYDGYGEATYSVDIDKFLEDNNKKFKITNKLKEKVKSDSEMQVGLTILGLDIEDKEDAASIFIVGSDIDGTLSQGSGLSNGDVITYSWRSAYSDEELEEFAGLFKVKLEYEDIEYTVSDLKEVPKFDPFDGVEISFSGLAPNGQALIANYPENGLYYVIDGDNQGLSNGDEITVTIQYPYGVEDYINSYNKLPNTETKTYTVEGLGAYITSASQVPEDVLNAMKEQSNDIILATTYNWVEGYTLDINYIGNYFLTAKDSTASPNNMFILVYKMHYENTVKDCKKKEHDIWCDYYFYVNWDDLQILPDGTFSYSEKDYYKTKNELTYYWNNIMTHDGVYDFQDEYLKLTFTGYEKLDDIYNLYITKNIENYKFEESIDESLADISEENTEDDAEENAEETE
ncbi:MAG: hypothetical protein K5988_04265 [Lachnospiraceae bacterium]|nr:hypothetical protein [Lachnospiraceae bacterium]